MHKVDDKFHGQWPPSHPTSLIIDKIQNCCSIFLFHSPPPSSALNNFCWCSENWWWCCACCSNQVRLEFMLKSHFPFYKLDVGSRNEKWGGGRKRGRQNLNVCRETMIFLRWMMVRPSHAHTNWMYMLHGACASMTEKLRAVGGRGMSESDVNIPTKASINDSPCGSIVCGNLFIYGTQKKTEEKCFFLRPHPRCTAAVRAAIPAREVKLNLSLRAM